jgi:transcriptional regulator with GAF, ATPase, and Fis domain
MASIFATLCFARAEFPSSAAGSILLFGSSVLSVILSFVLLMLLWQTGNALEKSEAEAADLRQREESRLQGETSGTSGEQQQQEVFHIEEMLARVVPAAGIQFDSAAACTEKVLQNIAKAIDVVQGLVFVLSDADQLFHISGQYAYYSEEPVRGFPLGETLSGQVAKNKKMLNLNELPDGYITVLSGLGKNNPRHLLIAPIVYNEECIGVMELASFNPFGARKELLVQRLCESIANLLHELRK